MKTPLLMLLACIAAATASAAAGLQTDLTYGKAAGETLRLDAYMPEGPGPFPAVILVHGGGWTAGDKSGGPKKGYMAPMHESLQRAGFAWFSINYRLAPKFRYPACVEDVETAIRWVKEHALLYHLDPKRIALAGESAGGHLVGLVAVRADESTRVAAVVPFYGRFDMTSDLKLGDPLSASMAALFGLTTFDPAAEKLLRDASAVTYVKPGLPPFLLVHGDADQSVPYAQSVMFQARLRAAGVPCDLLTIPGGVHGMINWNTVAPDYKDKVVEWLVKTLNVPAK